MRGVFTGGSRAMYSGKAVELTTAKGRRLSVTANHPILTPAGFVPARLLREGDQVLSYCLEPRVKSLGPSPKWHENHAPATAEEVFGALAKTGGPFFSRTAPDDFHGEAKRFRGDVEIVGSYANLPREWDPEADDEFPELIFEPTDSSRLSESAGSKSLGRVVLPTPSGPGFSAL